MLPHVHGAVGELDAPTFADANIIGVVFALIRPGFDVVDCVAFPFGPHSHDDLKKSKNKNKLLLHQRLHIIVCNVQCAMCNASFRAHKM